MNLLSNLLAFSSLNASADKEERPSSSGGRFMFQQSEMNSSGKERVTSKSLSKMSFMSNQNSKVDPKKKCLTRIAHTFNKKTRKHYYEVFVILESMKKNNITIQMLSVNPQAFEQGILKIAQTFSILSLKQYENGNKRQVFQKIKKFSEIAHFAKTIVKVCDGNVQRRYGSLLFSYSKYVEKLEMKIDLLVSNFEDIQKKSQMAVLKQSFSFIKDTNHSDHSPKCTDLIKEQQRVTIKTIPVSNDSKIQSPASENLDWKGNLQSLCLPPQNKTSNEQKQHELCDQSKITFTINPYPIQGHQYQSRYSLMQSTTQNCRSTSKSPYRNCKTIVNIRQSVDGGSLSLNSYQKITKAYAVTLDLNEKPLQLDLSKENMPKMVPKINPQEFSSHEVEDLADKSNIFRDLKKQNCLLSQLELQQSIRETMFDLQMNNDKYEMNERSQISYIPHMQHESSMSILNQKQDSSFGCQAVNFKNSLVLQRESMKKSDRTKVQVHLRKKNSHHETSDSDFNLKRRNTPKTICPQRKVESQLNNYESTFEELMKEGSGTSNLSHNFNFKKSNSNFGQANFDYNSEIKSKTQANLLFPQPVVRKLRYGSISEVQMKVHQQNSSASTSRSPIPNIDQMPVRDVGMDPTRLKYRNNSSTSYKDVQPKKLFNGRK